MLLRKTALLFVLLAAGSYACSTPPPADEADSDTSASDLTAAERDTELRDALHAANPSYLWIRCSRGRGAAKMTFDVTSHSGSPDIQITARYWAADYNASFSTGEKTELTGSMGLATITNTDIVHRTFAFKIGGEPATLDAMGDKGSFLRFNNHTYKVTCDSYDF